MPIMKLHSQEKLWELNYKIIRIILFTIILTSLTQNAFAQKWDEPGILENAPKFERKLTVETPRLSGSDVKILQERLIELGYTGVEAADGYFGPLTNSAFERFSSFNGIIYNDVVDRNGWYALFSSGRKSNEILPRLGNRSLIFAFDMWGIIDESASTFSENQRMDPTERISGFFHYNDASKEAVTARVQCFWESGPYSANNFTPSIIFGSVEDPEQIPPQ